jgi:hypothetical protein
MISGLDDSWTKVRIMSFIMHPVVSFMVNLLISNILGYFTGKGMVAGLANLGSSVIVGFAIPIVLRKMYDVDETVQRLEEKKAIKKADGRVKLRRVV